MKTAVQKLQARQEQENQALAVLEKLQKTLDENPKVQFKNAGQVMQDKLKELSGLSLYIKNEYNRYTLNIRYWNNNDYIRLDLSNYNWNIDHVVLLEDLADTITLKKRLLLDIQKTFDDSEELTKIMQNIKIELLELDKLPYITREFLKDTLHDLPWYSDFLKYN